MKRLRIIGVLTLLMLFAGCGGFKLPELPKLPGFSKQSMAENKYKGEQAAQHVYSLPADKLFEEVIAHFNDKKPGQQMLTDAANRSVTTSWEGSSDVRKRYVASVASVDDGHSRLTVMVESGHREGRDIMGNDKWSTQAPFRGGTEEFEIIKRLDPQKAAEIEAAAKKSAEEKGK